MPSAHVQLDNSDSFTKFTAYKGNPDHRLLVDIASSQENTNLVQNENVLQIRHPSNCFQPPSSDQTELTSFTDLSAPCNAKSFPMSQARHEHALPLEL